MSSRHALSVRIPKDTYFAVAELARSEGVDLNTKFNELVRMGLGENRSLTDALLRLVKQHLTEEEVHGPA